MLVPLLDDGGTHMKLVDEFWGTEIGVWAGTPCKRGRERSRVDVELGKVGRYRGGGSGWVRVG